MALAAGTRLGRYEVRSLIGAGGIGEVYRARNTQLQRDVALKILPTDLALDPERLARFDREGQALAAPAHPHIAQVYGFAHEGAVRAIVMELVDGPSLDERIARGPLLTLPGVSRYPDLGAGGTLYFDKWSVSRVLARLRPEGGHAGDTAGPPHAAEAPPADRGARTSRQPPEGGHMNRIFAALVAVLFALPGLASGSPGEGDRYRLVSTLRVSTLEKELNQGAAAGYRIAGLWYSGQLFAVLEKAPATEGPRQYRVLEAGSPKNLGTRIKESAAAGFRLVPRTLTSMGAARPPDTSWRQGTRGSSDFGQLGGPGVLALVMEKRTGSGDRYEYVVSSAEAGSNRLAGIVAPSKQELERAFAGTSAGGFSPVAVFARSAVTTQTVAGITVGQGRVLEVEHIFVGERIVGSSVAPDLPTPAYRLVAEGAGPEFQQALDAAASEGYRTALAASFGLPYVVVVMRRTAETGFEYQVAGGSDPLTLKSQATSAAQRGFRVHPDGLVAEPGLVLLEKAPGSHDVYESQFIVNLLRNAFDREFADAVAAGFVPVSVSHGGRLMALEKLSGRPVDPTAEPTDAHARPPGAGAPTTANPRLSLSTHRVGTLRKELAEASAKGYRVVSGSALNAQAPTAELSLNLDKVTEPPSTYEYSVVSAHGKDKLTEAISEAAGRGFRMVQGIVLSKPGAVGQDTIVLMERAPGPPAPRCEYRVVAAMRQSTFDKETSQAEHEGWTPVGTVGIGGYVAIFERQLPQK
jgi:hypothetical protein